jgi:hypothetical protein
MILRERPAATIVTIDNFSATYVRGYGEQKTMLNFRETGVAVRAHVRTADMRELPFADGSHDQKNGTVILCAPTGIRRGFALHDVLCCGSDVMSRFAITIDIRAMRLILTLAKR